MLNDFYTLFFFQWLPFGCWQEFWLPFSLWLVATTVAGMYAAESTYWEMETISLFFQDHYFSFDNECKINEDGRVYYYFSTITSWNLFFSSSRKHITVFFKMASALGHITTMVMWQKAAHSCVTSKLQLWLRH